MKKLLLVVGLSFLCACTPGSFWNPFNVQNGNSSGAKIGETTYVNIDFSANDAAALMDKPARAYKYGGGLRVNIQNIPANWQVSSSATPQFSTSSTDTVYDDTITTQTRVWFSGIRVSVQIGLPANTNTNGQNLVGQVVGSRGSRNFNVYVQPIK